MINAHSLSLSFGSQKVFDEISFTLDQSQHVGLVGRNGSGKSTLLKAIAHQQQLDSGSISLAKGKRIAYLPQEVILSSHQTVLEETFSVFGNIQQLEDERRKLETLLAQTDTATADMVDRYATVCQELGTLSPESARANTKQMLMGLGFSEQQLEMSVSTLSVGWKMRIVLAKLLLQKADFYLFDEPTNHLDIVTKDWFLQFLQKASFGFLIVSHERYFLDKLCDHILELEQGKAKVYTGNYTVYMQQKEHDSLLLETAFKQQQKEIAQKMETIQRFRAKANKARMAQSMMKALDKVERITLPPQPKTMNFSFPPLHQPGRIVLKLEKVRHRFGNKDIFQNISCEVERGQKIAIVAGNGVGKTTLFNIIANKLSLQGGTITFGHNVQHALFDQDQNATLQPNWTILENISYNCPKKTDQQVRTLLGSFLFGSEEVQKKVKVLSGGEKNRVGMVKILLQDANVMFLDEPTNHLDIPSKEILLSALKQYPGTLIFVSHDHDFVNKLATHILELTPHGIHRYEGNYDAYLYQKLSVTDHQKKDDNVIQKESVAEKVPIKNRFETQKKLKSVESKIEKLEQEIKTLELSFANLAYGSEAFDKAASKLNILKKEHDNCINQWEELSNELQ
ncbi:MAG: ABC-F family ATP-binding cassette domain-containing protein [Candidatus Dependentiae bacterium]|nr:ABC-F family ATP-binding cassette domain-containing protein [Candidatus Dependentiae bacterium]